MSDTSPIGLAEAARHLGVSIGVLRRAIRAGTIPAPPHVTATSTLPAEWLSSALAAVETSPHALTRTARQKVPAFARYKGTSAWRKYSNRVREYARFRVVVPPVATADA